MLGPINLNFRNLLLVHGPESKHFLQGLITKDIESLNESKKLIYAFLLNVKGRIFSDLFIWQLDDSGQAFALETHANRLEALQKALKMYKLRRPIRIEPMPEKQVHFCSSIGVEPQQGTSSGWLEDPRVNGFGFRSIQNKTGNVESNDIKQKEYLAYLKHRLRWGIAEGEEMHDQIPLNMNGDLMNAISFEKGCYIGQELVARTYNTGVVRRRVMPFHWVDPKSAPSELHPNPTDSNGNGAAESKTTDLLLRDSKGKRQGKLICSHGDSGLCLASVEAVPPSTTTKLFDANNLALEVRRPDWWPRIDQRGNTT